MNTIDWQTLALGFLAGVIAVAAVLFLVIPAYRKRNPKERSLSEGAAELLEVLAPAGLVLSASNVIRYSTSGALISSLTDGALLASDSLNALVDQARASDDTETYEGEISSPISKAVVFISARARHIGSGEVLLTLEDKTESRRLEEMRKDFLANISHELKTPIGAIGLLSEALANSMGDEVTSHKLIGNIRKEAKRMSALIKDIIQLSRIQSADTVASAERVDLNEIVRESIDRNSWRSEKSQVPVDFEPNPDLVGLEVFGDAEMLTVAIKNLIENAIIYSNTGSKVGVAITISEDMINIVVTDSGIGIPKDEQARVFERFYRVDQSRSRETGGSGLGLSIVKHAALSHLGDVQLFSKPGIGSTFTLRLPSTVIPVTK